MMDLKGNMCPKYCIQEWDFKKNGSIETYCFNSHKKVWWICSKGICPDNSPHVWQTAISHRTKNNPSTCPICLNQQICRYDYCNSLKYSSSELLKLEWDKNINGSMKNYTRRTHKKVWW